jgi:acetylcholinesterase
MQDLWLAFMRDPINGLPNQGWNAYVSGKEGTAIEFAWDEKVEGKIALEEFDKVCEGTIPVVGAMPPHNTGVGVV